MPRVFFTATSNSKTCSSDVVKADQTAREAELRRLRAVVDQADKQFQLEHDAGALLDRYGAKGGAAS